jgi:hypothetical protein
MKKQQAIALLEATQHKLALMRCELVELKKAGADKYQEWQDLAAKHRRLSKQCLKLESLLS